MGDLKGSVKAGYDTHVAAAAPHTGHAATGTTMTAGAGLTGGGSLAANRTFDVGANADGSIVVNANDIQVGVLATDAQHGNRGGGGVHANVVAAGAAGFMTGADKSKLDGIASGAQVCSAANVLTALAAAAGSVSVNSQKITSLAAATAASDAARFDQTQLPRVIEIGHCTAAPAATADRWLPIGGGNDANPQTADNNRSIPPKCTITGITVRHNVAISGDSLAYTVQKNGVDTAVTVTIASGATQGTQSGQSVSFNGTTDELGVKMVQSSTTAQAGLRSRVKILGYPVA